MPLTPTAATRRLDGTSAYTSCPHSLSLSCTIITGEVVLWQWVEHLRERWSDLAPQPAAEDAAAAAAGAAGAADAAEDAALAAELQAAELLECGNEAGDSERRQRQARSLAAGDEELERVIAEVAETVVHGEPFTERRSTFQVGCCCYRRPADMLPLHAPVFVDSGCVQGCSASALIQC